MIRRLSPEFEDHMKYYTMMCDINYINECVQNCPQRQNSTLYKELKLVQSKMLKQLNDWLEEEI